MLNTLIKRLSSTLVFSIAFKQTEVFRVPLVCVIVILSVR
jgi:hypothetical protein